MKRCKGHQELYKGMKGKHGHRQSQRNGAHIDMNVMLTFLLTLLKSVSTCKYLHFMLDTVIFFTDHWQISGGSDRNAHPPGPNSFNYMQLLGKNWPNNTSTFGVGTPTSGKSWISHCILCFISISVSNSNWIWANFTHVYYIMFNLCYFLKTFETRKHSSRVNPGVGVWVRAGCVQGVFRRCGR